VDPLTAVGVVTAEAVGGVTFVVGITVGVVVGAVVGFELLHATATNAKAANAAIIETRRAAIEIPLCQNNPP
jgi:hypothetical protein